MGKVIFKHKEQAYIYQPLLNAVNKLCEYYGKDALCVAGYRSKECQIATNAEVLARCKTNRQLPNGAVYNSKGQCLASAYGQSNHCFCIAMDFDGWIQELTNEQLKPFGLCKPIDYENWHLTLISLVGISQIQKIAIRDNVLKVVSTKMETVNKQVVQPTKPIVKDELADALKFICDKCKVDYDYWYKVGKENKTKYLDAFIIKIAEGFKGE